MTTLVDAFSTPLTVEMKEWEHREVHYWSEVTPLVVKQNQNFWAPLPMVVHAHQLISRTGNIQGVKVLREYSRVSCEEGTSTHWPVFYAVVYYYKFTEQRSNYYFKKIWKEKGEEKSKTNM